MAVKYDASTATITATYPGANPQISYTTRNGTEFAAIHLGVNSEPILNNNLTDPYLAAAIILDASIIVDGASVAEILNGYEFHIVQLISQPNFYGLYAGRTRDQGSLKVDYSSPPAMPAGQPLLSDAVPDNAFPFYEKKRAVMPVAAQVGKKWRVDVETCDHPFADLPTKVANYAVNGAVNYLYEVRRTLSLYTALVVADRATGDLDPIGYGAWKIGFGAKIDWNFKNGAEQPQPARYTEQSFTVDVCKPDTPSKEADSLMSHPPTAISDTYGAIMDTVRQSISATMKTGHTNSPYCKASATWKDSEPAKQFSF